MAPRPGGLYSCHGPRLVDEYGGDVPRERRWTALHAGARGVEVSRQHGGPVCRRRLQQGLAVSACGHDVAVHRGRRMVRRDHNRRRGRAGVRGQCGILQASRPRGRRELQSHRCHSCDQRVVDGCRRLHQDRLLSLARGVAGLVAAGAAWRRRTVSNGPVVPARPDWRLLQPLPWTERADGRYPCTSYLQVELV